MDARNRQTIFIKVPQIAHFTATKSALINILYTWKSLQTACTRSSSFYICYIMMPCIMVLLMVQYVMPISSFHFPRPTFIIIIIQGRNKCSREEMKNKWKWISTSSYSLKGYYEAPVNIVMPSISKLSLPTLHEVCVCVRVKIYSRSRVEIIKQQWKRDWGK